MMAIRRAILYAPPVPRQAGKFFYCLPRTLVLKLARGGHINARDTNLTKFRDWSEYAIPCLRTNLQGNVIEDNLP